MDRRAVLLKASIIVVSIILLLLLLMWIPKVFAVPYEQTGVLIHDSATAIVQSTPTEDPTVTTLNKNKLTQEVSQLQNQNTWWWNFGASLVTAVGIILGIFVGVFEWWRNQKASQAKELKDRNDERSKQAEARFQRAVEGLGDSKEETKVAAAIMLRTFLQPSSDYEKFYSQVFDLAVANLRLRNVDQNEPEPDSLSQALITVFKESFSLARNVQKAPLEFLDEDQKRILSDRGYPEGYFQFIKYLDARGIRLDSAYLPAADLRKISMLEAHLRKADLSLADLNGAFLDQVDLREANLTLTILHQTSLQRADMREATLSEADLSEADLREVDLRKADLRGADLHKAILYKAKLIETKFSVAPHGKARPVEADLSKADLREADLRKADLTSARLINANLAGADLSQANFTNADLSQTLPTAAKSLKGTIMSGVTGLSNEQLEACKQRGAKIEVTTAVSDHSHTPNVSQASVNVAQSFPPISTQEIHASPSDAKQSDSKPGSD